MKQCNAIVFQKMLFAFVLTISIFVMGDSVIAQTTGATTDITCSAQLHEATASGEGVVTAVMQTVIGLLSNTSEALYSEVIKDDATGKSPFIEVRNVAILLVIMFYGIAIIFNLANFKPGEILGILFKIGLILALTGPAGWSFFNTFIGDFFFGTMIEMIEIFMGQAGVASTGGYAGQTGIADRLIQPLSLFNLPMARVISTQFFITVVGSLAIPTYGLIMAFLLLWAGFNLLMALVNALFTYVKSIVGLWFLFALAPIFFTLLLFSRTRNLFEGWINMVLSFTLQAILLFAFLAFFITITTSSLGELMTINWCWTDFELSQNSTGKFSFWRPIAIWNDQIGDYMTFKEGEWDVLGATFIDGGGADFKLAFPLDPTDLMFFLLSSYISWQYAKFVPQIATELSSSGLRLSGNAEAARNFFSSRGWTPGQVASRGIGGIFGR